MDAKIRALGLLAALSMFCAGFAFAWGHGVFAMIFFRARSSRAFWRSRETLALTGLRGKERHGSGGRPCFGRRHNHRWAVRAHGHLEKLLSLAIADGPGVNVNESEQERSGIICGQFCGVWRGRGNFSRCPHGGAGRAAIAATTATSSAQPTATSRPARLRQELAKAIGPHRP